MNLQIADNPELPLYRRVVDAICDAVDAGWLPPETRLSAKTELARQFGVSLITINQGYAVLERRGVLVQKQGSGTYIEPDACRRLHAEITSPFKEVVVVIDTEELTDGLRQQTFITCDILAGLRSVLGHQVVRFVPSLTHESLDDLCDRSALTVQDSREGGTTTARYAILVGQDLVAPDYIVSPLETDERIIPFDETTAFQKRFNRRHVGFHFSYALLDIAYSNGRPIELTRGMDWGATNNGDAVILGDRVLGDEPSAAAGWNHHSHVTREGAGQWRGGIAWNDNHVETIDTVVVNNTQYGGGDVIAKDNIFLDDDGKDGACLIFPDFDQHGRLTDSLGHQECYERN